MSKNMTIRPIFLCARCASIGAVKKSYIQIGSICLIGLLVIGGYVFFEYSAVKIVRGDLSILDEPLWPKPLNQTAYNERMLALAHHVASTTVATSTISYSTSTSISKVDELWPASGPYPHGGAILPFHRIVAYYGNFYSARMGILGEFEPEIVQEHLEATVLAWEEADPDTPVKPAIHYIAMVAQGEAGADGMYRAVMPDEHIEKAYRMAQDVGGILFLDLQVGLSTLQEELPKFRKYLERPDVHLAVDPEFSMQNGEKPGSVIGRFEAADINYASAYLANIVHEKKLPPKVLIVHRFTENMVGDVEEITLQPEVQIVMHMDGWGSTDLKRATYRQVVELEPLQFAGLKIFYKNDLKPPSEGIFTPEEALELYPRPIYIQYQ